MQMLKMRIKETPSHFYRNIHIIISNNVIQSVVRTGVFKINRFHSKFLSSSKDG